MADEPRWPTVREMWEGYAEACGVPRGGVQWNETEQAFFSGVYTFFASFLRFTDHPDEVGAAWLETIRQECEADAAARIFHARAVAATKGKMPPTVVSKDATKLADEAMVETKNGIEILPWTPGGADKPTQIHILLHVPGAPGPMVIRLKTREGAHSFIRDLAMLGEEVFPA
ncbi:MAG: hypothetical protein ACRD68_00075 [Pyrinomonadaceae bacterium]